MPVDVLHDEGNVALVGYEQACETAGLKRLAIIARALVPRVAVVNVVLRKCRLDALLERRQVGVALVPANDRRTR